MQSTAPRVQIPFSPLNKVLGSVAEWFKVHVWKTCVQFPAPRVQIPSLPIFQEHQMHVRNVIKTLDDYWSSLGFSLVPSYDIPIGAATFHPLTFIKSVLKSPCRIAFSQRCRRPSDSIPSKLDQAMHLSSFTQYQVIFTDSNSKDHPHNVLELYEGSLVALGVNLLTCDFKYVEDHWNSPSLCAFGRGWEVALNGLEITQITDFDRFAGIDKCRISEIAYGVERIAMSLSGCSYADLQWDDLTSFQDMYGFEEAEYQKLSSNPLFDKTSVQKDLDSRVDLVRRALNSELFYGAYDQFCLLNYQFNLASANVGAFDHSLYAKYMKEMQILSCELASLLTSKHRGD